MISPDEIKRQVEMAGTYYIKDDGTKGPEFKYDQSGDNAITESIEYETFLKEVSFIEGVTLDESASGSPEEAVRQFKEANENIDAFITSLIAVDAVGVYEDDNDRSLAMSVELIRFNESQKSTLQHDAFLAELDYLIEKNEIGMLKNIKRAYENTNLPLPEKLSIY